MRLTRKVWKNFCDVLKYVYFCNRNFAEQHFNKMKSRIRVVETYW